MLTCWAAVRNVLPLNRVIPAPKVTIPKQLESELALTTAETVIV